jgi:hypothetical protein
MTNLAAFLDEGFAPVKAGFDKRRAGFFFRRIPVLRNDFDVFVVRKENREIRNDRRAAAFRRGVENLARVRKRMTRRIARRRIRVTNRADRRLRAAEKLLAVTAQTRFVARIFGDVGKRRVALADVFPVRARKLVARVAGLFVFGMRKLGVPAGGTLRRGSRRPRCARRLRSSGLRPGDEGLRNRSRMEKRRGRKTKKRRRD